MGREEWIAERDRAEACGCSEQKAESDPARRAETRASLHPERPGHDVLHEHRDRDDKAGYKATAWLVVPSQ
jgi:hypothetical protein